MPRSKENESGDVSPVGSLADEFVFHSQNQSEAHSLKRLVRMPIPKTLHRAKKADPALLQARAQLASLLRKQCESRSK